MEKHSLPKKIVKEKLPKEELFLRGGNGLDNFSEKMKKREKKAEIGLSAHHFLK